MIRSFVFWIRTGKILVVPTHRLALSGTMTAVPHGVEDALWRSVSLVRWDASTSPGPVGVQWIAGRLWQAVRSTACRLHPSNRRPFRSGRGF